MTRCSCLHNDDTPAQACLYLRILNHQRVPVVPGVLIDRSG